MTANSVYQKLVDIAKTRCMFGGQDPVRLRLARQDGKLIPDDLKPGALLKQLSAEDRAALSELTSDMTRNERPDKFVYPP